MNTALDYEALSYALCMTLWVLFVAGMVGAPFFLIIWGAWDSARSRD